MPFPQTPTAPDQVLAQLAAMRADDVDKARCFSLVYRSNDEHAALLQRAHALFLEDNALNPMAFKSLKRMEHEVVDAAAALFHGGDGACGTMTSGGTESLLLVVKTARDLARAKRPWIRSPELVMPATAHVAFDKAAHYFGVKIRRARVDANKRVDVAHVKRLINRNTVLLVGSAPQYPHGVVDPIEALGAVARAKNIPLHVDACVGGFLLPFVEKLGRPVPLWDFRAPGVTSISADLHKYGYAAKGASVLVYRSMDMLKHQFFVATEFPGGVYASPTIAGTRPGGPIAAAWAALHTLGEPGYLALARRALDASDRLRAGVQALGLEVVGAPDATIFAWRSRDAAVDTFAVGDQLEERGWHVDRQQNPRSIHHTVTAAHDAVVDDFLRDLGDAVRFVRAHPALKSKGNAAMYGMMAKVPARFLVRRTIERVMQSMYGPDGAVDVAAANDGLVGALLAKHGTKIDRVLDVVERLRGQA